MRLETRLSNAFDVAGFLRLQIAGVLGSAKWQDGVRPTNVKP